MNEKKSIKRIAIIIIIIANITFLIAAIVSVNNAVKRIEIGDVQIREGETTEETVEDEMPEETYQEETIYNEENMRRKWNRK